MTTGTGRGDSGAIRGSTGRELALFRETPWFPQNEAAGLRPPPQPLKRPPPCGSGKRGAVPAPWNHWAKKARLSSKDGSVTSSIFFLFSQIMKY